MEELVAENPDCVITRANIARFLYEHGQIKSVREAFDRYIGDHCKCYVGRLKVASTDAVRLIKEAGGTAILAHPLLYGLSNTNLQKMIDELIDIWIHLAKVDQVMDEYWLSAWESHGVTKEWIDKQIEADVQAMPRSV